MQDCRKIKSSLIFKVWSSLNVADVERHFQICPNTKVSPVFLKATDSNGRAFWRAPQGAKCFYSSKIRRGTKISQWDIFAWGTLFKGFLKSHYIILKKHLPPINHLYIDYDTKNRKNRYHLVSLKNFYKIIFYKYPQPITQAPIQKLN